MARSPDESTKKFTIKMYKEAKTFFEKVLSAQEIKVF